MMKYVLAFALMVMSTAALAQQSDPAFLQRVVPALQAQRNQALDAHAASEARAAQLTDDLAKAQLRIKELEPKQGDQK